MTPYPRAPTGGVREAPGHEIAVSGAPAAQRALWGFGGSGCGWGIGIWRAAMYCGGLEDSWTGGNGVEPLPGGGHEPGMRRSEARGVVAGR